MQESAPNRLLRWSCVAAGLATLAGCASVSTPPPSSIARSSNSGVAYSTGTTCYAPSPNLQAAYNQPYEINGQWYHPLQSAQGYNQTGTASWYDIASSSHVTAMGTAFHDNRLTAASRVLPLPTCVRVTNLQNGRSILVLVNDRGPFVAGRIMDLSIGSARALGIVNQGTAQVQIQAVQSSVPAPAPYRPQVIPQLVPVQNVRPVAPSVPPALQLSGSGAANSQAKLRSVVASAFASPQQPISVPAKPAAKPITTAVRPVLSAPQLEDVIYLISSQPMELQRAREEQQKLQAFGITTAHLVPAAQGYMVKIGPLASTDNTESYVHSLRRLQLGDFQLSQKSVD
ncbi:septal ring lytic transglycosylase RlpA family protein [Acidithiobacillus sp. AMEEHan]|uniref:septal ring lytic transglycosylase RlpA family protein n=1 Tax=Acidithiobacillus sp. AMEEHan TaxID=2994951 RepID=UPI0027E5958C|nr:septal ring lytic transglycosylase RlpA family protein [Acidithiobacillus sp. AMEEHan]